MRPPLARRLRNELAAPRLRGPQYTAIPSVVSVRIVVASNSPTRAPIAYSQSKIGKQGHSAAHATALSAFLPLTNSLRQLRKAPDCSRLSGVFHYPDSSPLSATIPMGLNSHPADGSNPLKPGSGEARCSAELLGTATADQSTALRTPAPQQQDAPGRRIVAGQLVVSSGCAAAAAVNVNAHVWQCSDIDLPIVAFVVLVLVASSNTCLV